MNYFWAFGLFPRNVNIVPTSWNCWSYWLGLWSFHPSNRDEVITSINSYFNFPNHPLYTVLDKNVSGDSYFDICTPDIRVALDLPDIFDLNKLYLNTNVKIHDLDGSLIISKNHPCLTQTKSKRPSLTCHLSSWIGSKEDGYISDGETGGPSGLKFL